MSFLSTSAPLVLALICLAAALRSAWLWYRTSRVPIIPLWETLGQIEPVGGTDNHWIIGMMTAAQQSAALNRAAAIWTGGAALAGAASTVAGALL